MEQARLMVLCKRSRDDFDESWEEKAFAEDTSGLHGGCVWPQRSYSCRFCKREFKSAQALGGHMNVHRRDRAKLEQFSTPMNTHVMLNEHQHHDCEIKEFCFDFQNPNNFPLVSSEPYGKKGPCFSSILKGFHCKDKDSCQMNETKEDTLFPLKRVCKQNCSSLATKENLNECGSSTVLGTTFNKGAVGVLVIPVPPLPSAASLFFKEAPFSTTDDQSAKSIIQQDVIGDEMVGVNGLKSCSIQELDLELRLGISTQNMQELLK